MELDKAVGVEGFGQSLSEILGGQIGGKYILIVEPEHNRASLTGLRGFDDYEHGLDIHLCIDDMHNSLRLLLGKCQVCPYYPDRCANCEETNPNIMALAEEHIAKRGTESGTR